jgi:hypothetical protein
LILTTEIFNEEEIENFFKEIVRTEANENLQQRKSFSEKNKILSVLVNRQLFILKILKLSIAKLKSYDETLLAKGLEWYLNSKKGLMLKSRNLWPSNRMRNHSRTSRN